MLGAGAFASRGFAERHRHHYRKRLRITTKNMKNHFAVTISDASGARHYTVKKTIKRHLMLALLLVVSVTSGSISYNYMQYQQAEALHDRSARLDRQLMGLGEDISRLTQERALHSREARAMRRELGKIERTSRLETGDGRTALAQRIRAIGQFYSGKEAEYSAIGDRLVQIEGMVNTHAGSPTNFRDGGHTLAARVNMAALSVQQETILHNSIPSGFPTETRTITSKFGYRIHPVTNVKSFHKGVDIRAKGRVGVHATADGVVRAANYSQLSGNRVIVQHNFGFESYYAHLHKMNVKPGDIIHKGQMVGVSGNSGQSAGPHLHYEVRYLGKPVNPAGFLQWEFGSHEIFTQVKGVKWPSLINLINKQITHPTLQLSQLGPVSPERPR